MRPDQYNERDVHALFDDALRRRQMPVENRTTIDDLMSMSYGDAMASNMLLEKMMKDIQQGRYQGPPPEVFEGVEDRSVAPASGAAHASSLDAYRPDSSLTGMPPREFVGPQIGKARLFPKNAMSLFTALGGSGKTTTLIAFAAHIAAGKPWGTSELRRERVIMYFMEEDQGELNRKFGAATHDWTDRERELAADNLRLISIVGEDPRLTARMQKGIASTPLVAAIAASVQEFSAGLLVLDHLQGFTDGDLNSSDTATALASAANWIVGKTGAAVVFAAHVNKSQVKAEAVEAGFTTGSLAFENAARQVTGLIQIPDGEAKDMALSDPSNYFKLVVAKNSYGPAFETGYLERELVKDFHTVRVVPYANIASVLRAVLPKDERIKKAIEAYVDGHPGTTKNKLDSLSGVKGQFGVSKSEMRRLIEEMCDEYRLEFRPVSQDEKDKLGLSQQVQRVLSLPD